MRKHALQRLQLFASKFGGNGGKPQEVPPVSQIVKTSLGALIGVGSLTLLHKFSGETDATVLIASSGSTAVLLFAGPTLPFSQPRNVIGGHLIAASAGVAAQNMLGADCVATPALAVSMALFGMMSTSTIHPPAGGTAIVAAAAGSTPFVIVPIFIASVTQVGAACLWHNSSTDGRRYPQYW